jgi:hypothetical protein
MPVKRHRQSRSFRRLFVLGAAGLLSAAALARGSTIGERASAGAASVQGSGGILLRQLYGELALDVRVADASLMNVTVADASKQVALILRARDVRQWADSATRVLAARARGRPPAGRWEAVVEEPGTRSGSMGLSRSITGRDTVITVYFADSSLTMVRAMLVSSEARAFVGAFRKAAQTYLAPKRPPPVPR